MAQPIRVPRLGDAESGVLAEWYRNDGDWIGEGSPVAAVDVDKVTLDIESPAAGYLAVMLPEGAVVPAGGNIGWILEKGEAAPQRS